MTDLSASLRALIEQWRMKGEVELHEATEKEMAAAMGVAAMRLHCANQLESLLRSVQPSGEPQKHSYGCELERSRQSNPGLCICFGEPHKEQP